MEILVVILSIGLKLLAWICAFLSLIAIIYSVLAIPYYMSCHRKYLNKYRFIGKHKWFVQGLTFWLQPVMEYKGINVFGKLISLKSKITHRPHWKNVPVSYFDQSKGVVITGGKETKRSLGGFLAIKNLPNTIRVEATEERRILIAPDNSNIEWRYGFIIEHINKHGRTVKTSSQISFLCHKGAVQIMYDGGKKLTMFAIDMHGKYLTFNAEIMNFSEIRKGTLYI